MISVQRMMGLVLLAAGLVQSQQEVYTAYSPGQEQYSLRPTPRLVPVKVRSYHPSPSLANNSPFSYGDYLPSRQPYYSENDNNDDDTSNVNEVTPRPLLLRGSPQQQASSPSSYISRPFHSRRITSDESGQPIGVKRVRIVQNPYALQQSQPIVGYRESAQVAATPSVAYHQPRAVQQQPAYYGPQGRQLVKVPQHQTRINKLVEEQEPEYPSDPNPQYNFSFDVKDDDFTNYQNRQESKEGGITKGSYSVVDPDGYVRTVTYTASPKGGFEAKVTREPTDVKIKFPVPTEAPLEGKRQYGGVGPAQYPQYQQQQQRAQPVQYQQRQQAIPYAQPQHQGAYSQQSPRGTYLGSQSSSVPSYAPRRYAPRLVDNNY